MKRLLPVCLTTLRLLLGPIALGCACTGVSRWIYLPILVIATLSDIFDGILARRWRVATPALRRYDSLTDVIYYLFILGATWILCRPVVERNWHWVVLILAAEALSILVCCLKFGKYPATHSYLAKFFGLCLLGGLIALLVFNAGDWAVIALMSVAVITNLEIILIHLLADEVPVDVKSIFTLRVTGKIKNNSAA